MQGCGGFGDELAHFNNARIAVHPDPNTLKLRSAATARRVGHEASEALDDNLETDAAAAAVAEFCACVAPYSTTGASHGADPTELRYSLGQAA